MTKVKCMRAGGGNVCWKNQTCKEKIKQLEIENKKLKDEILKLSIENLEFWEGKHRSC